MSGYTARELAGLPGMPASPRNVRLVALREGWAFTPETTEHGVTRRRYTATALPAVTQVALEMRELAAPAAAEPALTETGAAAETAHRSALERAEQHVAAAVAVAELVDQGVRVGRAIADVAAELGVPARSLRRWYATVRYLPRADWLAALLPGWKWQTTSADCHPRAWECYRDDYLRLEKPSHAECYRRLTDIARHQGWSPIPSADTLARRVQREVPRATLILRREGKEALARAYPAQERDRSCFHALQAVNADGHRFDVMVRWPDGTIARPLMVAWQDLYSGKVLSWRLDRTESADLVRLSFADMARAHGVPEEGYLDNGRAFASKTITGGQVTRFRFTIQPDELDGIVTRLGVRVHWTQPYHGQAKPIERAFLDLCESIARHPLCSGAYTGNSPTAKPENYGSRAVDLADFLRLADTQIKAHNARDGRAARTCAGRSFDATFRESYERSEIRRATEAQLRMLLLAAEKKRARRPDGAVYLHGNRYWSPKLAEHMGQDVVVRFDPDRLHEGVHVYALDNEYVCHADCIAAVGFADRTAARDHARARSAWVKAQRDAASAEQRFSADELGELHLTSRGAPAPTPPARPKVVRGDFRKQSAPARAPRARAPEELTREEDDMLLAVGRNARRQLDRQQAAK